MLTMNQVKESLPVNFRNNITQDMVNQLNTLSTDPHEARIIRDNVITFAQVLQEGRFKFGEYVKAAMYVSYKLMGMSNLESYKKTFPDRYADMVKTNKPSKDVASIVSAYNKGLIVTKITERSIVPSWVLNQDIFQKALETQHDIMTDLNAPFRDRVAAANSLIMALKKPDVLKAELEVTIKNDDGMKALEERLNALSKKQLEILEMDPNMTAQDIAEMVLVADMREVNP